MVPLSGRARMATVRAAVGFGRVGMAQDWHICPENVENVSTGRGRVHACSCRSTNRKEKTMSIELGTVDITRTFAAPAASVFAAWSQQAAQEAWGDPYAPAPATGNVQRAAEVMVKLRAATDAAALVPTTSDIRRTMINFMRARCMCVMPGSLHFRRPISRHYA